MSNNEHINSNTNATAPAEFAFPPKTADLMGKIQGCLIGGAAGDALGYAVEFDSYRQIIKYFGPEGITSYEVGEKAGKALISDDTQMTLFTAQGLISATKAQASSTADIIEHVRIAYLEWLRTQKGGFRHDVSGSWLLDIPELFSCRAPGATCLSALSHGGRFSTDNPANDSKGCGGVMRVAPVGLLYSDPDYAARVAAEAAAITHGHPLGYISSAALAYIVARCMTIPQSASFKRALMREIIEDCCKRMPLWFPENKKAVREQIDLLALAVKLAFGSDDDLANIQELGEGWVGEEALAIGVYAALRYESDFGKAIRCAVNHNGDSDSTGAVSGNIHGALHGITAIDAEWIENLELADTIMKMADDLHDARLSLA